MKLMQTLVGLLAYLGVATCRGNSRAVRAMSSLSSSLINFGKMDVTIHLSDKNSVSDIQSKSNKASSSGSLIWKPESSAEGCPCTKTFGRNPFYQNPFNIITKILTGNDMYSLNKNPANTADCCGSHEQIEETVFYEIGEQPSHTHVNIPTKNWMSPFKLDNSNYAKVPSMPVKTKTLDIILFPPKREATVNIPKVPKVKDINLDNDIKVVGKNKVNSFEWMPMIPIMSTIKKDLNTQVKKDKHINVKEEEDLKLSKNTTRVSPKHLTAITIESNAL